VLTVAGDGHRFIPRREPGKVVAGVFHGGPSWGTMYFAVGAPRSAAGAGGEWHSIIRRAGSAPGPSCE
jgi:hypothetical protein